MLRKVAALGLLAGVLFGGASAGRGAEQSNAPVNITSREMEYFSEKDLVIFTGKALAVQENMTISADRMEVTLGGESSAEERANSVRKIIAEGAVTFRRVDAETGKEYFGTGDRGVYDADGRIVTLTGKPKIWEGKNVITGAVMTFFLDEDRFTAVGSPEEPVGLTAYPEEEEKR